MKMITYATKTNVKTYKANEWRGHGSEFFNDLMAAPVGTMVIDGDNELNSGYRFVKSTATGWEAYFEGEFVTMWAVGNVDKFFFYGAEDYCAENDVDFDEYVVNIEFLYPAA